MALLGCEYELDRLEKILLKLIDDWVEMRAASHECEVHGDRGMCDEYEGYAAGVNEGRKKLSEVLKDLNLCIQRMARK